MFRGIAALNIDTKGRLGIPRRYRDNLSGDTSEVVLTIDPNETCLLLYPLSAWEVIEQKISALPSFDAQSRRLQRLLIGHATDIEIDTQGRILLPSLLRDYASLEKESVLVGQGKKFELWDALKWQHGCETWLGANSGNEHDSQGVSDLLQHLSL